MSRKPFEGKERRCGDKDTRYTIDNRREPCNSTVLQSMNNWSTVFQDSNAIVYRRFFFLPPLVFAVVAALTADATGDGARAAGGGMTILGSISANGVVGRYGDLHDSRDM